MGERSAENNEMHPLQTLAPWDPAADKEEDHLHVLCLIEALFANDPVAIQSYEPLKPALGMLPLYLSKDGAPLSCKHALFDFQAAAGRKHSDQSPFSMASSKKSVEFCMQTNVVAGDYLFGRLAPLWPANALEQVSEALSTLILHDKLEGRAADDGELLLEVLFLNTYLKHYSPLSMQDKVDVDHPVVRYLFWVLAFFLERIHPSAWDKAHPYSWIERAVDGYVTKGAEGLRSELFNIVLRAQNRLNKQVAMVDTLLHYAALHEAERSEITQDGEILKVCAQQLALMKPGTFHLSQEVEFHSKLIECTTLLYVALDVDEADLPVIASIPVKPAPKAITLQELLPPVEEGPSKMTQNKRRSLQKQMRKQIAQSVYTELADECVKEMLKAAAKKAKLELELVCVLSLHILLFSASDVPFCQAAHMEALLKAGPLPSDFIGRLFPCLAPLLDSALECFICFSPINLEYGNVSFLSCCEGGSFACADCVQVHSDKMQHAICAEQQVVRFAALLLKSVKRV